MGDNSDDLVLRFLADAGVDLPDGTASLSELDADSVATACCVCLNVIMEARGEEQRFPKKLSTNPGVRFRVCTSIATAILGLGFPDELGFSQILYPSEADSRKLLLFLVDQMPKGESEGAGSALASGPGSVTEQIPGALQAAMAIPWVPIGWQPKRALKPERAAHLRAQLHRAALRAALRAERQAAKEASLLGGKAGAAADSGARSGGFGDAPAGWADGASQLGDSDGYGGGGGGLFAHSALFNYDEGTLLEDTPVADGAPAETAAQRAERAEKEKLQAILSELDGVLKAIDEQKRLHEAARAAEAAMQASLRQLEGEVQQASIEQERRAATQAVRRRALELATDPEGSRKRLQGTIAQSAAMLMELAEEWEGHRVPLLTQIRDAQHARQLRREGAVKKMARVKQLRVDMRAMVRDLQERDGAIARLQVDAAKATGAPRASYTERIMDVVRNVRKQKAGIETILADIRESQKEVNTLSETLARSFSAADEVIFRDAVKSAASKQCYKALARMHEAFGNLVEHVQTIANSAATTADLQGKIVELTARNTGEAIERISADLKVMKAENAKLVAGGAVANSG